jgi:hypothetical protein
MEQADEMQQQLAFWDAVFATGQWLAANGEPAWEHLRTLVDGIRKALANDLLRAQITEDGELCLQELAELQRSFVLHNTLTADAWLPLDAWLRRRQCGELSADDYR